MKDGNPPLFNWLFSRHNITSHLFFKGSMQESGCQNSIFWGEWLRISNSFQSSMVVREVFESCLVFGVPGNLPHQGKIGKWINYVYIKYIKEIEINQSCQWVLRVIWILLLQWFDLLWKRYNYACI